jgi:hypothetical protein
MAKLPKYTLKHNKTKGTWDLQKDKTKDVIHSFRKKETATKGGVLKKTVGAAGGSVKIQTREGDYQEERTYPRSRDPKSSKG